MLVKEPLFRGNLGDRPQGARKGTRDQTKQETLGSRVSRAIIIWMDLNKGYTKALFGTYRASG